MSKKTETNKSTSNAIKAEQATEVDMAEVNVDTVEELETPNQEAELEAPIEKEVKAEDLEWEEYWDIMSHSPKKRLKVK